MCSFCSLFSTHLIILHMVRVARQMCLLPPPLVGTRATRQGRERPFFAHVNPFLTTLTPDVAMPNLPDQPCFAPLSPLGFFHIICFVAPPGCLPRSRKTVDRVYGYLLWRCTINSFFFSLSVSRVRLSIPFFPSYWVFCCPKRCNLFRPPLSGLWDFFVFPGRNSLHFVPPSVLAQLTVPGLPHASVYTFFRPPCARSCAPTHGVPHAFCIMDPAETHSNPFLSSLSPSFFSVTRWVAARLVPLWLKFGRRPFVPAPGLCAFPPTPPPQRFLSPP